MVYNPEVTDGEESAKAVTVPTSSIMSVFISHLKLLLGLEKPKLPEGTFLRSHSSGISDWVRFSSIFLLPSNLFIGAGRIDAATMR